MGVFADIFRSFLIPGLNTISGNPPEGLRRWIQSRNYQVSTAPLPERFELEIHDARPLLSAYAYDLNRMAVAANESCEEILAPSNCRGTAWTIVKAYYAAFYAAHALLAFLGVSCSQLETQQTSAIIKEYEIYNATTKPHYINSGYYQCNYEWSNSRIMCERSNASSSRGSHEILWDIFLRRIRHLANSIGSASLPVTHSQSVIDHLVTLDENMRQQGCNGGNWLSSIRNQVTYRHEHGTWFPYRGTESARGDIQRLIAQFRRDPLTINLRPAGNHAVLVATCACIVAACNEIINDISIRSPRGASFVTFGPLAYLRSAASRRR
jgi:hypothetical protein